MGALRTIKRKLSNTTKQKTRRERSFDKAIKEKRLEPDYKTKSPEEKRNIYNEVRKFFGLSIKRG